MVGQYHQQVNIMEAGDKKENIEKYKKYPLYKSHNKQIWFYRTF